jgi:hypothetical protein
MATSSPPPRRDLVRTLIDGFSQKVKCKNDKIYNIIFQKNTKRRTWKSCFERFSQKVKCKNDKIYNIIFQKNTKRRTWKSCFERFSQKVKCKNDKIYNIIFQKNTKRRTWIVSKVLNNDLYREIITSHI